MKGVPMRVSIAARSFKASNKLQDYATTEVQRGELPVPDEGESETDLAALLVDATVDLSTTRKPGLLFRLTPLRLAHKDTIIVDLLYAYIDPRITYD